MDHLLKEQLDRMERNQALIMELMQFDVTSLGYEQQLEVQKTASGSFEIAPKVLSD